MLMFNADELFERLGLTVNCEDCKRHNKDYISKCDNSTWMEVCDILDYMTPIDAVPVVRCRDCKWWSDWGNGTGSCELSEAAMRREDATDFCSFGERRDDERLHQ